MAKTIRQTHKLTVAAVLCTAFCIITAANNTRLCFKGTEADPPGNITLSCPDGQTIRIDEALFGRNKWGACVITDEDCVEKTRIFHECETLTNCTRNFKTYSTKCGYATVMFLTFSCLQVDPVLTSATAAVYTTGTTIKTTEHPIGLFLHVTTKTSGQANKNNAIETGLIVGCVLAAAVTVVALVIAITMVVRRLLQKNNPEDENDDEDLKSKNACCTCSEFSCFKRDQGGHSLHHKVTEKILFSTTQLSQTDKETAAVNKTVVEEKKQHSSVDGSQGNTTLSKQVPPAHDPQNKSEVEYENRDLDSNANSRIKSMSIMNDGLQDSRKAHKEDIKQGQKEKTKTARVDINITEPISDTFMHVEDSGESTGKNNFPNGFHSAEQALSKSSHGLNQKEKSKGPKYDAVSIPNTERGTVC